MSFISVKSLESAQSKEELDEQLLLQLKCVGVISRSFLSDKQYRRLIDRIVYKEYQPGEYIVTRDQTTESALYLVISGKTWLQREAGKSPALLPTSCNFGEEMLQMAEFKTGTSLEVSAPYSVWAEETEGCRCAILTMKACRKVFDIDRAEKTKDAAVSDYHRTVVKIPTPVNRNHCVGSDSDSSDDSSVEAPKNVVKKKVTTKKVKKSSSDEEKKVAKKKKKKKKPAKTEDDNNTHASEISAEDMTETDHTELDAAEEEILKSKAPELDSVPETITKPPTPPPVAPTPPRPKPASIVETDPMAGVKNARTMFESQIKQNEKTTGTGYQSPFRSAKKKVESVPVSPPPSPPPKIPPSPSTSKEGKETLDTEASDGSSGSDEEMVRLGGSQNDMKELVASPLQSAKSRIEAKNTTPKALSPKRSEKDRKMPAAPFAESPSKVKKEKVSQKEKEAKKAKKPPKVVSSMLAAKKKFENFFSKAKGKEELPRPPRNIYQEKIKTPIDYEPPVHKKSDIEEKVIKKAMDKRVVFNHLNEKQVSKLTGAFEKTQVAAGQEIVRQGEVDEYYYVVSKGECEYELNGRKTGNVVRNGGSFGEEALVTRAPRSMSVFAKTDTEVFKVDQKTYRKLLECETTRDDMRKRELLEKCDFLQSITPEMMEKMIGLMKPKKIRKGEMLVRKEDFHKAFYIIDDGEVQCKNVQRGKNADKDCTLGQGGFFGVQALVDVDSPMKADIIGSKGGKVYTIDRAKYRASVGTSCDLVPVETRSMLGMACLRREPFVNLKDGDLLKLTDRLTTKVYSSGERIIEEDEEIEAALYILRKGDAYSNKGSSGALKGRMMTVLATGSFFGDELFLSAREAKKTTGISPYQVTAKSDCVCSVLSVHDYYEIFRDKVGRIEAPVTSKTKDKPVKDVKSKPVDKAPKAPAPRLPSPPQNPKKEPASPRKLKPKVKPAEPVPVIEPEIEEQMEWPKVDVPLENLERRVCLGEGNFGQVWLVVDKTGTTPDPYVLKIQSKYHLISEGEAEVCIQEKSVLSQVNHTFIVDLVNAYQDPAFVYMMLEFVQGGELFSVMNPWERVKLPENQAKFYALAIADALAYMHSKKFVYRDLKPENVLIDAMGYPKVIDLGFAKKVQTKTFTLCGTPGYLAPEVVKNIGHNWAADHWQLGILIYEMVSESSPFFEEDIEQMELYRCVVEDEVPKLDDVSNEVWDIIVKLLAKDPTERLGSLARGERDILHHPWFKDLSLRQLKDRKIKAPWAPNVKDPFDTSSFDDWSDLADVTMDEGPKLSPKQAKMFENF